MDAVWMRKKVDKMMEERGYIVTEEGTYDCQVCGRKAPYKVFSKQAPKELLGFDATIIGEDIEVAFCDCGNWMIRGSMEKVLELIKELGLKCGERFTIQEL